MCKHRRQKQVCKDCGGGQICEHDRIRRQCRDCRGSAFCVHRNHKNTCKECKALKRDAPDSAPAGSEQQGQAKRRKELSGAGEEGGMRTGEGAGEAKAGRGGAEREGKGKGKGAALGNAAGGRGADVSAGVDGRVEGAVDGVCGVCGGLGVAHRLIPCGHLGVCESCGDHEAFFDGGWLPFGACSVCVVESEEPYFVRVATLEEYQVFYAGRPVTSRSGSSEDDDGKGKRKCTDEGVGKANKVGRPEIGGSESSEENDSKGKRKHTDEGMGKANKVRRPEIGGSESSEETDSKGKRKHTDEGMGKAKKTDNKATQGRVVAGPQATGGGGASGSGLGAAGSGSSYPLLCADLSKGKEGSKIPCYGPLALEIPAFKYRVIRKFGKFSQVTYDPARTQKCQCEEGEGCNVNADEPCGCVKISNEERMRRILSDENKEKAQWALVTDPEWLEFKVAERERESLSVYTSGGRLSDFSLKNSTEIWECNPACDCHKTCMHKLVQKKFETEKAGWKRSTFTVPLKVSYVGPQVGFGLHNADKTIKKGTPVIEYIGEVMHNGDLPKQKRKDLGGERWTKHYVFDFSPNKRKTDFVCDGFYASNCARFINHSCDPNLCVRYVRTGAADRRWPRLIFFARRDIAPNEELSFACGGIGAPPPDHVGYDCCCARCKEPGQ